MTFDAAIVDCVRGGEPPTRLMVEKLQARLETARSRRNVSEEARLVAERKLSRIQGAPAALRIRKLERCLGDLEATLDEIRELVS